jgi:hypothetical protein
MSWSPNEDLASMHSSPAHGVVSFGMQPDELAAYLEEVHTYTNRLKIREFSGILLTEGRRVMLLLWHISLCHELCPVGRPRKRSGRSISDLMLTAIVAAPRIYIRSSQVELSGMHRIGLVRSRRSFLLLWRMS